MYVYATVDNPITTDFYFKSIKKWALLLFHPNFPFLNKNVTEKIMRTFITMRLYFFADLTSNKKYIFYTGNLNHIKMKRMHKRIRFF